MKTFFYLLFLLMNFCLIAQSTIDGRSKTLKKPKFDQVFLERRQAGEQNR